MVCKKFRCLFLGLVVVFSSLRGVSVMTEERAFLYSGLSAVGLVGMTSVVYKYSNKFFRPSVRDCVVDGYKIASFLGAIVIGYILHKKTLKFILREAETLCKKACAKKMFSLVQEFYDDYEGFMEAIDIEYLDSDSSLIDARCCLNNLKKMFVDSKRKFNAIKELVIDKQLSESYLENYNLSIDVVKDRIEQIDIYLKLVSNAIMFIKKHPNYLQALNLQKQKELVEVQNKMANELWWANFWNCFK